MGKPHAMVIPYPAQGHVIPLLEFSQLLVSNGIKVTFVNSDFNHQRILKSLSSSDNVQQLVDMVSIPDGMAPWDDRNDIGKLSDIIFEVMPKEMEALIEKIKESQEDPITCVVADWTTGFAFEIAKKLGLKSVAFSPASATALATSYSVPKLISDGIMDSNGKFLIDRSIRLYPTLPEMDPAEFIWSCFQEDAARKSMFNLLKKNNISSKLADKIICNSSLELEPAAFSQFPDIIPVGPLLACNHQRKEAGHFWPEDSDCLAWLDQQAPNSVTYIAFGSLTVFDQTQFQELALGLELTNRPFLWVVRQDLTVDTNLYPTGFKERVGSRGRMIGWAPQQQVISHPSVAIFLSHCGWNSTVEGIANGVPFLCWPYFADQFLNQACICDEWKVGLRLNKDENGIIRKEEVKNKVECLMQDQSYKERALNLQAKTMASVKEGSSYKNISSVIEYIKN